MMIIKRLLGITMILTFMLVALTSTASAQQKYAVLISAGQTTLDDQFLHSEYWYDLFLMYRMLIEDGFTHNNIYVLYGDGNDFNSIHTDYQTATIFSSIGQITDYPNSKLNVQNIFTWLGTGNVAEGIPQIQPGDFLFYWWMGHGIGCSCADYQAKIENTSEWITDDEFASYFSQLPACVIKTQFVMTCRSGGLIDDQEGLHSMIHTAAECCTNASSGMYDVPHADFSYHVACSFREQLPDGSPVASDVNGDLLVSVEETNDYAHVNTTSSNTQIGDIRNIAPLIYIANAQPAVGVPDQGIYSRDYAEDNGTEPSEYMSYIWYKGPDLWVRHAQDGLTTHQDPEFGQTNYVYASIHNIGCNTVEGTAELSWCLQTAWANPGSWNTIATIPVNIGSGESMIISAPWTTVPVPGTYCLHTVLNAPGDPANADGRAYMDNNKVQINVDVEDNVWGWTKNFHWLIENGFRELSKVDLVVEKLKSLGLKDPPKLTLQIPRNLKFDQVIGADLKESVEGNIIEISPKTRKVVLQGIVLKPKEKKEVVLSVITPKSMKLGESFFVKVSEQINGREMGGILFNTRAASQKQVLKTLFGRISNLFKMLDKKFKVNGAKEVFKFSQEVKKNCKLDDLKNLKWVIADTLELESKTIKGLSRLMNKKKIEMYKKALKNARTAFKEKNMGLFVESQEKMIFSTKSLFLRDK